MVILLSISFLHIVSLWNVISNSKNNNWMESIKSDNIDSFYLEVVYHITDDVIEDTTAISDCKPFPLSSLNALFSLYNDTNGINWGWQSDSYGQPWNFSIISIDSGYNPCNLMWIESKSISLNTSLSCDILSLSLSQYKLTAFLISLMSFLKAEISTKA